MTSAALKLEEFGAELGGETPVARVQSELERQIALVRSEAHARGYEEGAAAAIAAYDSELKMLLGDIAERLSDADLSATAARAAALRALAPLVQSLIAAICPALGPTGLAAEVSARMHDAIAAAPGTRPVVTLSPDMVALVEDKLAAEGYSADIRQDPTMPALRARVSWAGGFDEIDVDETISQANSVVDSFFGEARTPLEMTGSDV